MKNWCVIALLLPFVALSQEEKKDKNISKLNLHVITSGGVAGGDEATKPVIQLSGGLMFGSFYTGIGVGGDFYHFRTIPLFADLRYSFGRKKSLFVYANGGYNFVGGGNLKNEFGGAEEHLKGGLYLDGGIGLELVASPVDRVGISIGFSRKSNVHTYSFSPCTGGCLDQVMFTDRYTFNRIVSRLSWNWGR